MLAFQCICPFKAHLLGFCHLALLCKGEDREAHSLGLFLPSSCVLQILVVAAGSCPYHLFKQPCPSTPPRAVFPFYSWILWNKSVGGNTIKRSCPWKPLLKFELGNDSLSVATCDFCHSNQKDTGQMT